MNNRAAVDPLPLNRAAEGAQRSESLALFVGRQLFWLVASVIVVSGVALALILVSLRGQTLRSGERLTESFARIIAEQTNSMLQSVDHRLQLATMHIAQMKVAGTLNESSARNLLREEIRGLPFVRALSLSDAQGRIAFTSEPGTSGQSVADRAYFQIYGREPGTSFYVGPPVRGRVSGAWLISASRPLSSAKGTFDGVIVAAMEPSYFDRFWSEVDLGAGGSIALFRRDGLLLMRSPFDEAVMGKSFEENALFRVQVPQSPSGSFEDASPIDGVVRTLAYRTLTGNPDLLVVVGRVHGLVLAPWRQLALVALGTWALAAAVIIVLGVFLNHSWRQRMRTEIHAQEVAQRLVLATDAASIGVWDWDLEADQWSATPTYHTVLGYASDEPQASRDQWLERIHPDDREMVAARMTSALAGADAPYQHEARALHADGSVRWVRVIGRVLARDEREKPTRLLGVMMDITESKEAEEGLRKSVQEQEALLKEVHHRVKNNLQVIMSLLRLETGRNPDLATQAVLKDMQGRIRSMALLHETLYRTGKFARVDLADYLGRLATQLFRAHNTDPGHVRISLDLQSTRVEIDQAIPCGLIVNELLTNSLKHAFAFGQGGEVRVELTPGNQGLSRLRVSDTGAGLPSDFDPAKTNSLGLQLVSDLARQLGGRMEIEAGPGAAFSVFFPTSQRNTGPIVRATG